MVISRNFFFLYSDPEIQFKQSRRTTRASTRNNSPSLTLKIKKKHTKQRPAAATNPTTVAPPKRPRLSRSRKSSINCPLCSEVTEDLTQHLSLSHFKSKFLKLLPSQPPYKCPKCALLFNDKDYSGGSAQDGLIIHYGGYHKLNDKFLEEELKKLKMVKNGLSKNKKPQQASQTTTSSPAAPRRGRSKKISLQPPPSPDSRVECDLCGTLVSNLKDHAFEDHFKEEILASLPRSPPFRCPKCSSTKYDNLDRRVVLEYYTASSRSKKSTFNFLSLIQVHVLGLTF